MEKQVLGLEYLNRPNLSQILQFHYGNAPTDHQLYFAMNQEYAIHQPLSFLKIAYCIDRHNHLVSLS